MPPSPRRTRPGIDGVDHFDSGVIGCPSSAAASSRHPSLESSSPRRARAKRASGTKRGSRHGATVEACLVPVPAAPRRSSAPARDDGKPCTHTNRKVRSLRSSNLCDGSVHQIAVELHSSFRVSCNSRGTNQSSACSRFAACEDQKLKDAGARELVVMLVVAVAAFAGAPYYYTALPGGLLLTISTLHEYAHLQPRFARAGASRLMSGGLMLAVATSLMFASLCFAIGRLFAWLIAD
jgi:hypothetical protein